MNLLKKHHFKLILTLIFLLSVMVYGISITFEFINLDDALHLQDNPNFKNITLNTFINLWSRHYFGLFIPVSYSIWGLEILISKTIFSTFPSASWFHFINVIIHSLNTCFVFLTFKYLLYEKDQSSQKKTILLFLSAIGALFFCFHPIQVESVAWISERRGLLSFFFSILAIYQFVRIKNFSINKLLKYYFVSSVLVMMAILSKPNAVIVPGIMLFLIPFSNKKLYIRHLVFLGILLIPTLALVFSTSTFQPFNSHHVLINLWEKIFVAMDSFDFYLHKIINPKNFSFDYGRTPDFSLKQASIPYFFILYSSAFLSSIIFRKYKLSLTFLIIAASLLPTLGLIPFAYQNFSTVADRYAYFSLFGFSLLFILILKNIRLKPLIFVGPVLILILFAVINFQILPNWKNSKNAYNNLYKLNKNSFFANSYMAGKTYKEGKKDLAKIYYKKVVIINTTNRFKEYQYANQFFLKENYKKALSEYIELNKKAKKRDSEQLKLWYKIGTCYEKLGNYKLAKKWFTILLNYYENIYENTPTILNAQNDLLRIENYSKAKDN